MAIGHTSGLPPSTSTYKVYHLPNPGSGKQEPTESIKQPIRARYLGHVTGYHPIRDQYFLVRSVPAGKIKLGFSGSQ